MIKKTIIRVIPAAFLVALSAFLLKGDVWTFWTWYLLAGVLGIVGMAVTGRLFRGFADKGWMFSKVVSITITGFLTWFLVSVRILKFTTVTCVGITAAFGVACIFLYERQRRQGYDCRSKIWILFMQRRFCFLPYFFCGPIWQDFIRQHTGQRNLWTMVSWKP